MISVIRANTPYGRLSVLPPLEFSDLENIRQDEGVKTLTRNLRRKAIACGERASTIAAGEAWDLIAWVAANIAQDVGLNPAEVLQGLFGCHLSQSVAIGRGIAIPHLKHLMATATTLAVVQLSSEVWLEMQALDRHSVGLLFCAVMPDFAPARGNWTRVLSILSEVMRNSGKYFSSLTPVDAADLWCGRFCAGIRTTADW
jgi:mannitol/fructose-specific phosphotransferase system IIA component (Ntr-type)